MGNIPSPYGSLPGFAQGLYGLAEIQQAIALYETFVVLNGGSIPTTGGVTGVLPTSLGAKTSAQSLPVVLATDEATLPGLMPDASSYESIGANVTGTIKNSSGRIYSASCTNLNAATRYLQFFDAANNSGTPKRVYPVYGNSGVLIIGQETFGGNGLLFSTGIVWGFSTTALTYTAGSAADCILAVRYL